MNVTRNRIFQILASPFTNKHSKQALCDFLEYNLNPLRPNNDLSQTSHCNIKGLSAREVMRIENMITQVKFFWYLTASPHYFCKKCMETQKENL